MEKLDKAKSYINFCINNNIELNRIYKVFIDYFMENKENIRKYNKDFDGQPKETMYINIDKRKVDKLKERIKKDVNLHFISYKKDYSRRFEFAYKLNGYYDYNETRGSVYMNLDYLAMIQQLKGWIQKNIDKNIQYTLERWRLATLQVKYNKLKQAMMELVEPLTYTTKGIISDDSEYTRKVSMYIQFLDSNKK